MARTVLFLCVQNSARSQMAEGICKALGPPGLRVFSAGSAPADVNPVAVQVLGEIGLDISDQRSKSVDDIDLKSVDTVITLCAEEVCPLVHAGSERLHWPLPDPAAEPDGIRRLEAFRHVRDQLRERIGSWLETHR